MVIFARSGFLITRGMTQCHKDGKHVNNENDSQKKIFMGLHNNNRKMQWRFFRSFQLDAFFFSQCISLREGRRSAAKPG